jgi:hypothetical protein
MELSKQFFITLPSNTTSSEDNTASKFYVRLPYRLHLHGEWECGLTEIVYPHVWLNIKKDDLWFKIETLHPVIIRADIPPRYYDNVEDLLKTLNWKIEHCKVPVYPEFRMPEHLSFSYNLHYQRVFIYMDNLKIKSIEFSERLKHVLGFAPTLNNVDASQFCENLPDIRNGFETMYIYCNIVEPQIVGDTVAPLLRTIKIEGKNLEIVNKVFDVAHYVPVTLTDVGEIEIHIKNDSDEYINFLHGKTLVKLHFRKAKKGLFL